MKAKRIREKNAVKLTLSKAEALSLWRILGRSHLHDNVILNNLSKRDEPTSLAICTALRGVGLEYAA